MTPRTTGIGGDNMVTWFVTILRVLVGALVMKTGADLIQGKYIFIGFSSFEPFLTGMFLILIGIHIIFSSTIGR
jgi:hypothetical protein